LLAFALAHAFSFGLIGLASCWGFIDRPDIPNAAPIALNLSHFQGCSDVLAAKWSAASRHTAHGPTHDLRAISRQPFGKAPFGCLRTQRDYIQPIARARRRPFEPQGAAHKEKELLNFTVDDDAGCAVSIGEQQHQFFKLQASDQPDFLQQLVRYCPQDTFPFRCGACAAAVAGI
jgi:hypothetical protein